MMIPQSGPPAAHAFLDFVNASPTPFHAVSVAARRLEKSGFCKVLPSRRGKLCYETDNNDSYENTTAGTAI
jgi:aspartyl aminopeptidase